LNIIALIEQAEDRVELSPVFADRVQTVLALLRTLEVVPYRRAMLTGNSRRHAQFAGAIALAHELGYTIDVPHRSCGLYVKDEHSSLIPQYLSRACSSGVLQANNQKNIAKGRLTLTSLVANALA